MICSKDPKAFGSQSPEHRGHPLGSPVPLGRGARPGFHGASVTTQETSISHDGSKRCCHIWCSMDPVKKYPLYVSIYTSTMDPMGMENMENEMWKYATSAVFHRCHNGRWGYLHRIMENEPMEHMLLLFLVHQQRISNMIKNDKHVGFAKRK